eukprot:TRINITY_DN1832_c0_g2_i1.p1 TRINITY_DN1832_c0_g2~~TRINITY_DN1832_c0_g2_i1.p1  ORF type:complete len:233 (+),score=45.33 TRINITY_DN1832_c0_g2_i1:124-822(+)
MCIRDRYQRRVHGGGKSKRTKKVALTEVKKKDQGTKLRLVEKIHKFMSKYSNVYVFQYKNMTTKPFREVQAKFADAKFLLGKNKVMQVALGKNEASSHSENSYLLSQHLTGESGLLFTNRNKKEIKEFFDQYAATEFAKVGDIPSQSILLEKGTNAFAKHSNTIEPYLRKLGLNTTLDNAEIILNQDYVLAEKGKPLNVEQCKILRLIDLPISEFRILPVAVWNKKGSYQEL